MKKKNILIFSLLAMPLALASCTTNKNTDTHTNQNNDGSSEGDSQQTTIPNGKVTLEQIDKAYQKCVHSEATNHSSYTINSTSIMEEYEETTSTSTFSLNGTYNSETKEFFEKSNDSYGESLMYATPKDNKTLVLVKNRDSMNNSLYPSGYLDFIKYETLNEAFGEYGQLDFTQTNLTDFLNRTFLSCAPDNFNQDYSVLNKEYSIKDGLYTAKIEVKTETVDSMYLKFNREISFNESGLIGVHKVNEIYFIEQTEKLAVKETNDVHFTHEYSENVKFGNDIIEEIKGTTQYISDPEVSLYDENYNYLAIKFRIQDELLVIDESLVTLPGLKIKYYINNECTREIDISTFKIYHFSVKIFIKFEIPNNKSLAIISNNFQQPIYSVVNEYHLLNMDEEFTFKDPYLYEGYNFKLTNTTIDGEELNIKSFTSTENRVYKIYLTYEQDKPTTNVN